MIPLLQNYRNWPDPVFWTCPTEVGPIEEMRKLLGIRENPREIRLIGLSKRLSGAKLQMWLGLADL